MISDAVWPYRGDGGGPPGGRCMAAVRFSQVVPGGFSPMDSRSFVFRQFSLGPPWLPPKM